MINATIRYLVNGLHNIRMHSIGVSLHALLRFIAERVRFTNNLAYVGRYRSTGSDIRKLRNSFYNLPMQDVRSVSRLLCIVVWKG